MPETEFAPVQRRLMDFVKERLRPVWRQYHISKLVGDASTRQYFRFETHHGDSFILAVYPEPFEVDTFSYRQIYELFRSSELPVPEILDLDGPRGIVVQQDVGNISLQRRLIGADPRERLSLLEGALQHVLAIQDRATLALTPHYEAYHLAFDFAKLQWELEFFQRHFLHSYRRLTPENTPELNEEFQRLAAELAESPRVLCHRDYHVRNLMCKDGLLYVIDFQDARWGPPAYDVASLLKDSIDLSLREIEHLISYYANRSNRPFAPEFFERQFHLMCIQRLLKALGTYGYQITVRSNHIYEQYVAGSLERVLVSLRAVSEFPRLRCLVERELESECGEERRGTRPELQNARLH